LSLVLAACGDDESSPGARSECAAGGELNDCPDAERTPEDACWRLVECGAIGIKGKGDNDFNWGHCVDDLERSLPEASSTAINCIAASTCDQLRVDGSPDQPNTSQLYCLVIANVDLRNP
jgi:hypothetical protein